MSSYFRRSEYGLKYLPYSKPLLCIIRNQGLPTLNRQQHCSPSLEFLPPSSEGWRMYCFSQVCVCPHPGGGGGGYLGVPGFFPGPFWGEYPSPMVLSQVTGPRSLLGGTPVLGSFPGPCRGGGYPSHWGIPQYRVPPPSHIRMG